MQNTQHETLTAAYVCNTSDRIYGFANQLGGIADMCKRQRLDLVVLYVGESCCGDGIKTQLSKMQHTLYGMADVSCVGNTSDTMLPILTCQALLGGHFPRQILRY